jgi:D-alanyl-D-alanine carboxypeptidase
MSGGRSRQGHRPTVGGHLAHALPVVLATLLGLAAGTIGMLTLQRGDHPTTPTGPAATPTAPLPSQAVLAPVDNVLLVWTPDRLPAGLASRVRTVHGVSAATVVRGDLVGLTASFDTEGGPVDRSPRGMAIPLDAIAFDPASYPSFVPVSARATFRRLGPEQVLLGSTSARLRRLGPGGRLVTAGGRRLAVAGVVDDSLVGAAEIALTRAGAVAVGVDTDRYLLLAYQGGRAGVESGVRRLLPPGLAVRFRGPGETPFLRNGDAVLPQVLIKERFGEFAYRPGRGLDIVEDPAWAAADIVTARVPLLGRVRCHRALIPALSGAMNELRQRNLAGLVDPRGFGGCWNPRLIRADGGISRHAWGAAVDLNVSVNPTGLASAQDPRLVEVMQRWGFTSGARWLVPDPSHFEYLQPA